MTATAASVAAHARRTRRLRCAEYRAIIFVKTDWNDECCMEVSQCMWVEGGECAFVAEIGLGLLIGIGKRFPSVVQYHIKISFSALSFENETSDAVVIEVEFQCCSKL